MRGSKRNTGIASPISTVILTGTIMVIVLTTAAYADRVFLFKVAESDFKSAKQFMRTLALQVDDVAWLMGKTETLSYSSRFGEVTVLPSALNYTVYVKVEGGEGYEFFASYVTDILVFNIPLSSYSLFNGYYESILPPSKGEIVLWGAAVPAMRVFAVEKLPMGDGEFVRVVAAPSMRILNSTVEVVGGNDTLYLKLYLPILRHRDSPRIAQSVTLRGVSVTASTIDHVESINVTVSFPQQSSQLGFDESFFQFPSLSTVIDVPEGYSGTVLELHIGEVDVTLGLPTLFNGGS